jgi:hypothetical protein
MTFEQVRKKVTDKFDMINGWNVGGETSNDQFVKEVAIEYAIGVLQEIDTPTGMKTSDKVNAKIQELKKLL